MDKKEEHFLITFIICLTGVIMCIVSIYLFDWLMWIGSIFIIIYLILFGYWEIPDLYGITIKEWFKQLSKNNNKQKDDSFKPSGEYHDDPDFM